MKTVQVIKQTVQRRLKVAAYCRVSTSQAEQLDSLDNQCQHYEAYIKGRKDWQYAGIYYDKGVTGTSMDRRKGFCQLLEAAMEGKIDLILVKSISRFARNTIDCLNTIRALAQRRVYILFEQEQIYTRKLEDEFWVSILSALAENESEAISANTKWGIRQSFKKGTYRSSIQPYGYDICEGELIILPHEAIVVQEIFALAAAGCGPYTITETINSMGFRTRKGKNGM